MFSKLHPVNLFKVEKKQWPRIRTSWMVNFLYRLSFMLGWTTITAIFVHRVGIESLPFLFIGNALLVMIGSMIFSELIRFIKKETLITINLLIAAVLIFTATTFILPRSEIGFLIMAVGGISLFLGQMSILIQLYIEDMFSPLESESAFPMIETAEIIGAITAGLLLTTLSNYIAPYKFLYIIILSSLLIIPTIVHFKNKYVSELPDIKKRKKEKMSEISKLKRIEEGWTEIKKTGFLQGIVVVILCQFILFNLIEFQYTKAIQQSVYHAEEETLVQSNDAIIELSSLKTVEETAEKNGIALDQKYEKDLASRLGLYQMIFSIFALMSQLLLASKVIRKFGIVKSLLLHPALLLMNAFMMTFKFNIMSAAMTKTGYEMTRAIFQNAYLSSYYAIREEKREEIKEFIEGIVVPLGAIIGTLFIFAYEILLSGYKVTLGINITLIAFSSLMAYVIFNLQKEYTKVNKKTLKLVGNTTDKINSIEILSQKGHKDAWKTLTKALNQPLEQKEVKVKILKALGEIKEPRALNAIMEELKDDDKRVQIAAIKAIGKYKSLHSGAYDHIFTTQQITQRLKELFEKKHSKIIKQKIIEALLKLDPLGTANYLLSILNSNKKTLKADAIEAMSFFEDKKVIEILSPYLNDQDIEVKCKTMITLWQFPELNKSIIKEVDILIEKIPLHEKDILHVVELLGHTKIKKHTPYLEKISTCLDTNLRQAALIARIEHNDTKAVSDYIELMLCDNKKTIALIEFIEENNLSEPMKKYLRKTAVKAAKKEMKHILNSNCERLLSEFCIEELQSLKLLHEILEQDKEVLKLSEVIESKRKKQKNHNQKLKHA